MHRRLPFLTPVVDHVGIGPIESVRMRTLHRDTLRGHSISVGAHAPVGIVPSQAYAGLDRHSARGREPVASFQQLIETTPRARTAAGRAELYVTELLAALRSGPVHADRE